MADKGLPSSDRELLAMVAGHKDRATTRFAGRNAKIDEVAMHRDRDALRKNVFARIPEEYRKGREPSSVKVGTWVKDHLVRSQAIIASVDGTYRFPDPRVPPIGGGVSPKAPKAKENADLRERWLRAAYIKAGHERDVWGQITDALAADTECWWRSGLRLTPWGADYEMGAGEGAEDYLARTYKKRRDNFPFYQEFVPTKNVYPLRVDDRGLAEVLEVSLHEAPIVADTYNLVPQNGALIPRKTIRALGGIVDSTMPQTVEVWTYTNRDSCAIIIQNAAGGEVVKRIKHNYGRTGYFHASFSTTSLLDPALASDGIADSLLDLEDEINLMSAIIDHWALLSGFPMFTLEADSEDAISAYDNKTVLRVHPGGTLTAPPGYHWRAVPLPPVGQDLVRQRDFYKAELDELALAPILLGRMEGSRVGGPVASVMVATAKARFGPGMANLARAYDDQGGFWQQLVETHVKAPVPIEGPGGAWIELGPDDIDGYYTVEHRLAPIIPMERQMVAAELNMAHSIGAIDMDHLREYGYGLTSPTEMGKRVRVEEIANSDAYKMDLYSAFRAWAGFSEIAPPQAPGSPPTMPVGAPLGPQLAGVQQAVQPGQAGPAGRALIRPNGRPA